MIHQSSVLRCDQAPAWGRLRTLFETQGRHLDLRQAFAREPRRFETFSCQAPEVFVDLSKNFVSGPILDGLVQLAQECDLASRRDAMLRGEVTNVTEGRAVLHTALRAPLSASAPFATATHEVLERMLAFAETIRDVATSGIRHVVNIGIGGSDLGPQMVVPALQACAHPDLEFHFVSNVDGHDIASVLARLNPDETLFVVASKTFTTQETMANAKAAKLWFAARGGRDVAKHFVATTTQVDAAAAFGITTTFGFWDWVGGRYSLWSSIGLPIALAIGATHFRALLAGAHEMDRHFAQTPLRQNVPVLLGLLDVWYRNFFRFTSRCVAPYHQGLRRLPAYLQQLEMESNGKSVDVAGQPLPFGTSPVIWGEPGTNGQHAYFQMLHQGTDVIPVEFILVKSTDHGSMLPVDDALTAQLARQQVMLLANGLAQSQALMLGKSEQVARDEQVPTAAAHLPAAMLAKHRTFPGNRPSSTLVLERLTPRSLGALIALYEHRVFVSGALWGINSFDQWGVELGKALCKDLLPRLDSGQTDGLDGSTAGLMSRLRSPLGCTQGE